jgi:hypothetical protein
LTTQKLKDKDASELAIKTVKKLTPAINGYIPSQRTMEKILPNMKQLPMI